MLLTCSGIPQTWLLSSLGDGKEKTNLQARAAEMSLENVVFIPPVPKDEMSNAIAAADVCIAILKPIEMYKTVYPNKVFDYMAAGRPVVLAIDGVIREVVDAARAGIAVPPGNPHALAETLQAFERDRQLGPPLGQNGRAYVEQHFDRVDLANRLLEIMITLLNPDK